MINDPVNFVDLSGFAPLKGTGTSSKGPTGNPVSGGNLPRTPGEQVTNRVLSKIVEKLTNKFLKIDPFTGRFVPNPVGVFIIGISPKQTAICQTLSCDLDGDGLDDNAFELGFCKPGFN